MNKQEAQLDLTLVLETGRDVPAPAFALKALFGEFATVLPTSKRVLPLSAQEAGFEWESGRLDTALADLLD